MARLATWAAALLAASSAFGQSGERFEKEIRPLLETKCTACHAGESPAAGLDLSTAAGFRKGADVGPVVGGEDPLHTPFMRAVLYGDRVKMPPSGKLTDREIASLTAWVRDGAPWPEEPRKVSTAEGKTAESPASEWWSFLPVQDPAPPAPADSARVRTAVDRFWLRALDQAGLAPAGPADKRTLIRRATFDLTGLPPTPNEIAAFLADDSGEAFAKVVDRLLASPRYGEQWGRRWLDAARYADSTGQDEDHHYPYAWRYRDYVVEAFNDDLPYDRFVREQIAGDLLPAEDGGEVNARGIVATGFLALGPRLLAEVDRKKMLYDLIDEQIDTTSKAFLGLTIACARCHDHKFDPISTKDYYSLAAIFAGTRQFESIGAPGMGIAKLLYVPLVPEEATRPYYAHLEKVEAVDAEIRALLGRERKRFGDRHRRRLADYMEAAWRVYAGGAELAAIAEREGLDPGVLRRWADYLKPPQERRPFLDEWYATPADEIPALAERYQRLFEDAAARRAAELREWERAAERAKETGTEPPPKPRYPAGEDRFFTEMNSSTGPFGLNEDEEEKILTEEAAAAAAALRAKAEELKQSAPEQPPLACGVAEGEPVEQTVFIRGDWRNPGERVRGRMPTALTHRQPQIAQGSGRRELADWIASADNPLTARVMVNRIWQGHFSHGIVAAAGNFGRMGEAPSHPALLDYLARRFIESGWSVKAMHRLILNSAVYQTASTPSAEAAERDPENRLLSHYPRRRLQAEEIRDALLAIGGDLDLTMGGPMNDAEGTEMVFMQTSRLSRNPDDSKRRSVYLPLRRSNAPSMFTLFDFADRTVSTAERASTNIAPQALYWMNSTFVERVASRLAARLEGEDAARVHQAHEAVLGRPPDDEAVQAAAQYLAGYPGDGQAAWTSYCRALLASSGFVYVD